MIRQLSMIAGAKTLPSVRALLLVATMVVLGACRDAAAPAKPAWQFGPGCTLLFVERDARLGLTLRSEHAALCPRVVYDSTLAAK